MLYSGGYAPSAYYGDHDENIRQEQLEALLRLYLPESKPRISSALAHLFWLACKKNPLLDEELLKRPYKLLNIFQSWAQEEGIDNPLNGDTLKNALKRGTPSAGTRYM